LEHRFGHPEGQKLLGPGDRMCNEPLMKRSKRTFHLNFDMLPGGDLKCIRCGQLQSQRPVNEGEAL
jgi:hypothetical protein